MTTGLRIKAERTMMDGARFTATHPDDQTVVVTYWNGPGSRLYLVFGSGLVCIDHDSASYGMGLETFADAADAALDFASEVYRSILTNEADHAFDYTDAS